MIYLMSQNLKRSIILEIIKNIAAKSVPTRYLSCINTMKALTWEKGFATFHYFKLLIAN